MADFNESYVEQMVKYHREINKSERQVKRDNIIYKRRGLLQDVSRYSEQTIKPGQVITFANRIKHKGSVCEEDLKILNCAFIQGENNINAFLNAGGTLHALVRELIGMSSLTQLAAAECFINLSLGNSKCCLKIAKAAGPYLITHLQGMNLNLQIASIWALGNLLGSDIKTWNLLNSQGVLPLLLNLLPVPELQENVLYSLIRYVKTGFDEIPSADFSAVATSVLELKTCSANVMWLLYLLSCSNYCDDVISQAIIVCLDILTKSDEHPIKTVTASIRILSNVVSEESGLNADIILKDFDKIYLICDKIVGGRDNYPHLTKELIWFIGNLVNHPSNVVQCKVRLFIEKINLLQSMLSSAIK